MLFLEAGGVVLHYQLISAGNGKPAIVFSNSLGTDFRIWRDVAVALAGEFTLVTYDKRGHGLSDAPQAPYDLQSHVADIAALIDHLGVGPAFVCGLSVGGVIAQGLYRARPELVRGLILCDTSYRIGSAELWNERIAQAERDGLHSMGDAVMARWFTQGYREQNAASVAGYRNMLTRQSVAGYAGTMAMLRDTDLGDACGAIDVPTLCLVGDQDVATPPDMVAELARFIPGSRFEVIAGAGHLPCIEQPQVLSTLIRDFIQSTEDRETA